MIESLIGFKNSFSYHLTSNEQCFTTPTLRVDVLFVCPLSYHLTSNEQCFTIPTLHVNVLKKRHIVAKDVVGLRVGDSKNNREFD